MTGRELEARFLSSDPEERRRATSELVRGEPEVLADFVLRALSDEDWRVRKEAVAAALSLAPSRAVLRRLVQSLAFPDNVGLRNAAVEALGGYGEDAVDALAGALSTLDADGRKLAVEALGRVGRPSSLVVLSSLLDDPDANVRIAAVEAVAAIALAGVGEATGLLERCLFSPEPLPALAALDGLNALGRVLSWSVVERCLKHGTLRRSALVAAGRSGDPRAAAVLLDALAPARGRALVEVTSAIRDLARETEALTALRAGRARVPEAAAKRVLGLLHDDGEADETRRAALVLGGVLWLDGAAECALSALGDDRFFAEAHETLELLGARAVPALAAAAGQSGDAESRASCLALLSRLADAEHAPAVVMTARSAIRDESSDVQREAFAVLARFGDAGCLADLDRYFSKEVAASSLKAAEAAFRELCTRHADAARSLARSADADGGSAHAACLAVGALGGGVRGSVEADIEFLSAALSNSWGAVRRAAVEALADIGGARGVDAVAFALTDEERDVRRVAVAALGRMRAEDGSAAGLPHLVDLAEGSPDPELLGFAIRALGETGDPDALPVLRPLARSPHPFIAVSAVEALGRLAGGRRVDALLEALSHSDAEVVKATMLALSDAPDPRVIAHLGACLDHEAWDVRRLAADLLGRVSGEAALGLLRARLGSEDSPPVQEAIARALERMAGIRRTPVPSAMGSLRPR